MTRVLILSADASYRVALAFMLDSRDGIRVVAQAANIAQARAAFTGTPPDVAMIDTDMPDEDGIELIRELRPLHATTVFVALTGSEHPESRGFAIAAGADATLPKDASIFEIEGVIRMLHKAQPPARWSDIAQRRRPMTLPDDVVTVPAPSTGIVARTHHLGERAGAMGEHLVQAIRHRWVDIRPGERLGAARHR